MTTSLLNETQAAERLGLKPETLRRWRWSGDGPAFLKIGGAVRYEPSAIEGFIDRARQATSANEPR